MDTLELWLQSSVQKISTPTTDFPFPLKLTQSVYVTKVEFVPRKRTEIPGTPHMADRGLERAPSAT